MKWMAAVSVVAAFVVAAPAHAADPGQSVTVSLTWSPGGCISVSAPTPDRTHPEQKLQCAGVVGVSQDTYAVAPGQWYGIDPVEAANPRHSYSCTVSMNGEEMIKQSGWAVDCLRQFA